MRNEPQDIRNLQQLEDGDWLSQIIAGVQDDIARQPTASAVKRIRARLLAKLSRPERAAA